MSEYKLVYFNCEGVAEPIRFILKYAKVPFEEERINFEDWPKNKPRFPLGAVPVLIENGKHLTQSAAILRYLAKKFDLYSGDDQNDYKLDQIVEITMDGRQQWHRIIDLGFTPTPEQLQNVKDDLTNNVFPKILKQLSGLVGETKDGNFILGKKVTYADLILGHWLHLWVNQINENLLNDFPVLIRHKEAVFNLPGIKEWIQTRPPAPF